jgi:GTPase
MIAEYTKQHPNNIDGKDTHVISYKRPARPLIPRYTVPMEAMTNQIIPFESPVGSKLVETAVVGPPNWGKSSLINTLLGMELTASSDKKGTTNSVKEVFLTKGLTQWVFKDTPGATKADNSLRSTHLISKWWNIIPNWDVTLFVVDGVKRLDFDVKNAVYRLSKMRINLRQKAIEERMDRDFELENLKDITRDVESIDEEVPVNSALVMNKVDLVTSRRKFNYLRQELEDIGKFDHIFNVSARTGFGIEELLEFVISQAKRREWKQHPDLRSSNTEVQKVTEIMKQGIFRNYYYEIPHEVDIKVIGWTPKTNGELIVDYRLSVNRHSTKALIIGKNGRILDGLRKDVELCLSRLYQKPVMVNIQVVKNNFWIQDINQ